MSTIRSIKLVAIDLDGTLLNNSHQLSPKTINTLRRLSAAGVIICIATGRSTASIRTYLDILQLNEQRIIPCISYNGAYGMVVEQLKADAGTITKVEKPIFHNPLPREQAQRLLKFAASNGWVAQYYDSAEDNVYAVPLNDEHKRLLGKYAYLVGRDQVLIDDYKEALDKCDSTKMLIMTTEVDAVLQEASKFFTAADFHMIRGSPDPFFVEFLRPDVCKGHGLQAMCAQLGVAMAEVAAFGDGDNDKEMLQSAGIGVAMQNAKDAAKAAADIVIRWTNEQDGVAKQLEEFEAAGYFRC